MLSAVWQATRRSLSVWLDPVCQNPDALMYTEYKGVVVRLVPVYNDAGDGIERWVPDPAIVQAVDAGKTQQAQTPAGEPQPPPLDLNSIAGL